MRSELYPIAPGKLCAPNGLHLLGFLLRLHVRALRCAWRMGLVAVASAGAGAADVLALTNALLLPEQSADDEQDPDRAPVRFDPVDLELFNLVASSE